jgi:hypothetical protein
MLLEVDRNTLQEALLANKAGQHAQNLRASLVRLSGDKIDWIPYQSLLWHRKGSRKSDHHLYEMVALYVI